MEFLTTMAIAATLSVPARTNANVSLAAEGRTVVAVWAAAPAQGAADLFAAVSLDSGATFGAPVRVNSTAGDVVAHGEQPPRVVLVRRPGKTPAIVIAWMGAGKAGASLLTARSDDGGRSYGPSSAMPGSSAPGARGWQSAVANRDGNVRAFWLDHRGLAAPAAGAKEHSPEHAKAGAADDGTAMAQRSSLYTSVVGNPASVHAVTSGVCYCCKTAVAAAADGTVYAAWRQVYPGSIRDIATTMSRDGGRTFAAPVKVSDDRWVLNGCPDDGPALVVDAKSRLHVVWPTVVTDGKGAQTLALFYATSTDGRTFTPRQRVPTEGVPHHPQLTAAADGSVVLAWDESGKGPRRVAFARAEAGRPGQFTRLAEPGAGIYPVVVATPDGVVAAWTIGTGANTQIQIERLGGR